MREIEFRAKGVNCNKWYYGFFVQMLDIENKPTKNCIIENMSNVSYDRKVVQDFHMIELNTLGQFTGLKDKNGRKIFEGDNLKSKHNADLYNVYWEDSRFLIEDVWGNRIKPTQTAITHFECEIVGNIYDNPELAKE